MPEQVNPSNQQPSPAQPTSSGSQTSTGINWKNILIGVIIGAVLFGGGGFLVYNAYQPKKEEPAQTTTPTTKTATPSSKPTKEKEIYCTKGNEFQHQKLFKVCLPKEFKYTKYNQNKKWVMYWNKPIPEVGETITFIIVELSDKSFDEEIDWNQKETEKEIVVDGVKAIQQTGTIGYGPDVKLPEIRTIFAKSGQTYVVSKVGGVSDDFKKAYDQLISTFKFL